MVDTEFTVLLFYILLFYDFFIPSFPCHFSLSFWVYELCLLKSNL